MVVPLYLNPKYPRRILLLLQGMTIWMCVVSNRTRTRVEIQSVSGALVIFRFLNERRGLGLGLGLDLGLIRELVFTGRLRGVEVVLVVLLVREVTDR